MSSIPQKAIERTGDQHRLQAPASAGQPVRRNPIPAFDSPPQIPATQTTARISCPINPREAAVYLRLDDKTITRCARRGYIRVHALGEGINRLSPVDLLVQLDTRDPCRLPHLRKIDAFVQAEAPVLVNGATEWIDMAVPAPVIPEGAEHVGRVSPLSFFRPV